MNTQRGKAPTERNAAFGLQYAANQGWSRMVGVAGKFQRACSLKAAFRPRGRLVCSLRAISTFAGQTAAVTLVGDTKRRPSLLTITAAAGISLTLPAAEAAKFRNLPDPLYDIDPVEASQNQHYHQPLRPQFH